jgi:hypothetical protein
VPDTFRIVTIGVDGRRRLVEDLEVADVVYTERDTRTFAPGAAAARTSSASTRYGGSLATGEVGANGTISATLASKARTPRPPPGRSSASSSGYGPRAATSTSSGGRRTCRAPPEPDPRARQRRTRLPVG